MTTRYFLQPGKINRKGLSLVMLDLRWRGLRLKLSTGVQVLPEAFDPAAKQLLSSRQENYLALNWKLRQLALDIVRDYLVLEGQTNRGRDITVPMVDTLVRKLLGTSKPPTLPEGSLAGTLKIAPDIWDVHARWQHLNRLKYSDGHLRRFLPVKKWLDVYAPNLVLDTLTEEWVQEYLNWLLENTPLRNGSLRAHVSFFRTMLKFSRLPHDWLDNPFNEYTSGVDLWYEEVQLLYTTDYLFADQREKADVYVFLCQVGLRWGDYLKLESVQTVQTPDGPIDVILDQRQGKTKEPVTVALTPLAHAIWHKYNGRMPKWSNQEFNREIKKAARAAGLTRTVNITTVRGTVYTTVATPLWQAVTAHTARHTAACLLREASGSNELSQLTLGQASAASTSIYARPKQLQDIADSLAAWRVLDEQHAPAAKPKRPDGTPARRRG